MSATWIIARKEIQHGMNSQIVYLLAALFAIAPAFPLFWNPSATNLFLTNHASMEAFFSLLPLFLMVFVPALAMRAYAEERHSGNLELVLSHFQPWPIVLGKFLGNYLILLACLLATAAIPVLVSTLGDLDWGPVIGGYLAACLLAACCLALTLLIGTFCPTQTTAFTLAIALLAVLMVWDIPSLNLRSRFEPFTFGLMDSRHLGFYGFATLFFLYLNRLVLSIRR